MKNIFLKNETRASVLFILLIGAVVYRVWLSFSAFAFGDWAFAFSETLKDYIYPSTWGVHGGALLWKYPLLFIYGIFGNLGLSFNVAEKFTVLWPIIFIAPLSSFLLVKKLTKSNLGGVIGSLVFSYNSYFLSIDTQGHELLTVAFAFAPLAILTFIEVLESKKIYWIPITVLLLFVIGFYDLRSLYVTLGAIGFYALYYQLLEEKSLFQNIGRNIRNVFLVFFLFGLASLYWLIPVLTLHSLTTNEFLIRQLFGGQFYSLSSALNLFYPFWTGREPTWFYVQRIPLSFWLYPILAFAGLAMNRKNKKVIFFALLAIVGIFLTKQEAPPFSQVYLWLYTNIPGFAAFREASKFYFLIALSYGVLIGSFAVFVEKHFRRKKLTKYLFISLIVVLPLLNTIPILSGEIKTTFVSKVIPNDFILLKNFIVNDMQYSRVLGINQDMYYNFSTNNHPTLDALYSLRNFWGGDIVSYNFLDEHLTQGEKLVNYLKSDEGKRLVYSSSIGYITVTIQDKQTNNNIRRDLGKNRDYFKNSLDKINYLTPIDIKAQNILLYKVKNPNSHAYLTSQKESLLKDVKSTSVTVKAMSPTEYKIQISNISSGVYLNFSELYHPDWKIHPGEFSWSEAFLRKDYSIPESFHSQNAVRFNSFLIDPKYIKEHFNNNQYKLNSDGSMELNLTLYSQSESGLYVGLIISGMTLVLLIFSAVYLYRKEKSEKN